MTQASVLTSKSLVCPCCCPSIRTHIHLPPMCASAVLRLLLPMTQVSSQPHSTVLSTHERAGATLQLLLPTAQASMLTPPHPPIFQRTRRCNTTAASRFPHCLRASSLRWVFSFTRSQPASVAAATARARASCGRQIMLIERSFFRQKGDTLVVSECVNTLSQARRACRSSIMQVEIDAL